MVEKVLKKLFKLEASNYFCLSDIEKRQLDCMIIKHFGPLWDRIFVKCKQFQLYFKSSRGNMICCNENNSIAVLNCFLSSLIYSMFVCLIENIQF